MERPFGAIAGRGMRVAVYWIVVILVVLVDQSTKAAAREVYENAPRALIPGVVNLVHVENTGAAFSMGQGASALFVAIALAFLVGTVTLVWRTPDLPMSLVVPVGLVAGGGLGNMIDRIIDGSVTDFIATAFIDFPVFNVADICVTVGVTLCVVGFWVWDARKEEADAALATDETHV